MCKPWDLGCQGQKAAESAIDKLVEALADGLKTALEYVATFWLETPSPTLAEGSGQGWVGSAVVTDMQSYLMPVTAAFAVVSFSFALLQIAMNPDRAGEGLKGIARQLSVIVLSTLPALAVAQLLLEFSDEFSPWLVERGAGVDSSEGFQQIMVASLSPANMTAGVGLYLLIFILALLGAIAQCVFMVIRSAAIIVLFALLPLVAAGAATEEGWQRVKRVWMLIIGFVLYKVVAAAIYGTGLRLMSDTQTAGDDVQNALYGLTVIIMGALALPAFIKFVMPMAAAGSSSAFSGGAVLGAVASGAAVMSLGGAGAGAAAGRGAGAGAGAGAGGSMGKGPTPAAGAGDLPGKLSPGGAPRSGGTPNSTGTPGGGGTSGGGGTPSRNGTPDPTGGPGGGGTPGRGDTSRGGGASDPNGASGGGGAPHPDGAPGAGTPDPNGHEAPSRATGAPDVSRPVPGGGRAGGMADLTRSATQSSVRAGDEAAEGAES